MSPGRIVGYTAKPEGGCANSGPFRWTNAASSLEKRGALRNALIDRDVDALGGDPPDFELGGATLQYEALDLISLASSYASCERSDRLYD
jgi:hypothetical protein